MTSNNSSWSARLSALDAASRRLADKTQSLNKLLHNLQHISAVSASTVASAAASAPRTPVSASPVNHYAARGFGSNIHTPFSLSAAASASSSPRVGAMAAPPAAVSPSPHALAVPVSSAFASASAQIQRVRTWLAALERDLQRADASASNAPLSAQALETLNSLNGFVLASQPAASRSPRLEAKQPSSAAASPRSPARALSASGSNGIHASPSPSPSATPAPSLVAPAAKHSALMTIKPMQSGANSIHGVPVPAGTAFINGRWTRVAPSPGPRVRDSGSEGGSDAEDDALALADDEEADPFADFTDEEEQQAPATPRKLQQQSATLAPASGSLRGKRAVMSGTLRRRAGLDDPAGTADINEDDLAGLEIASGVDSDTDPTARTNGAVLIDGQWRPASALAVAAANGGAGAGGNAAAPAEEDDPFADIDDLEVDEEEESRCRAAERARTSANAAALSSGQKSAATVAARAKALARKTTTLRMDLSKHMGKDDEINEDDFDAVEEEHKENEEHEDKQRQQQQLQKQPEQQKHQQPQDREEQQGEPDELADMLESPRAQRLFAPDLEASKRHARVTALSTRREGQAQQEEEWDDVELSAEHLRHASASLSAVSAGADDRPDDLDGLDDDDDEDEDEDEQALSAAAAPSKLQLFRGSSGGSSEFALTPRSPSSLQSRRAMSTVTDHSGDGVLDESALMDASPATSKRGLSSASSVSVPASVRKGTHRPGHRHSSDTNSGASSGSNLSLTSSGGGLHPSGGMHLHGQLSASLSAEEGLDLDGAMDEDEEATPVQRVHVDSSATRDRATRELREFAPEQEELERMHAAERSHLQWFGGERAAAALPHCAALHRPIDPAWLLRLSALRAPPASVEADLPFLAARLREIAATQAPHAGDGDDMDASGGLNGHLDQFAPGSSGFSHASPVKGGSASNPASASKQKQRKQKKGGGAR